MQSRKESDFEIFQREEKESIAKIKQLIETKQDEFSSSLSSAMLEFGSLWDDVGQKRFVYLMAALLKQGVSYAALYVCGSSYIGGYTRGYTADCLSKEEAIRRRQAEEENERMQEQAHRGLNLMSLIAHSVCAYEEMETWLATHRESEPNNPYVKIIDCFKVCPEIRGDMYLYDIWKQMGKKAGFKEKRNAMLTSWRDAATPYPILCGQIDTLLGNEEIKVQALGCYVYVPDATKVRDIIFSLIDLELRRLEFDLFQKENHEAILQIKGHIEAEHSSITDDSFSDVLSPFCLWFNSQGQKQFIYLCMALVKQGVCYETVRQFGIQEADGLSIGFDCGPASPDTARSRAMAVTAIGTLQERIVYALNEIPMMLAGKKSYDEVMTQFAQECSRKKSCETVVSPSASSSASVSSQSLFAAPVTQQSQVSCEKTDQQQEQGNVVSNQPG